MSTLQLQIIKSLDGLSEDSLSFILDMIQKYVAPADAKNKAEGGLERFFSLAGNVDIDSEAILALREDHNTSMVSAL